MLQKYKTQIAVIGVGALLFLPGLGLVHLFDWDEINFAESAREMLASGDYFRVLINYQPFWEKPPLFIWLQALSMKLWGVNEYAARFPNALTGIATLWVLYIKGKEYGGERFGRWWVLAYIGTFLPHFYFKSGIIDPLFNLFIFLSVWELARLEKTGSLQERLKISLLAGLYAGLGVLTKGPVAALVPMLCLGLNLLLTRFKQGVPIRETLLWSLSALLVSSLWFGIETARNGWWFLQEFIEYQVRLFRTGDSGHGQPVYYHPLVLLFGCFPASLLFIRSLSRRFAQSAPYPSIFRWMQVLFWVVLVLFSIVKTKIVHYSSLCYFPLTFLATDVLMRLFDKKEHFPTFLKTMTVVIGLFWSLLLMVLIPLLHFSNRIKPYIQDRFAAENLNAQVNWTGFEPLGGLVLFLAVVFYLFGRQESKKYLALYLACCFVVQWTMYCIVPGVERISQGAAIDFFKEKEKEDAYVNVIGYKSYAHYFYTKRKQNYPVQANDLEWLMNGKVDKPVYLVTKVDRDYYTTNPNLIKLYERNGFVFYKRK